MALDGVENVKLEERYPVAEELEDEEADDVEAVETTAAEELEDVKADDMEAVETTAVEDEEAWVGIDEEEAAALTAEFEGAEELWADAADGYGASELDAEGVSVALADKELDES